MCVKQVVKLFWIVAAGYVILLAGAFLIERYFWHGGLISFGVTTLMFTACTLTLLYSA